MKKLLFTLLFSFSYLLADTLYFPAAQTAEGILFEGTIIKDMAKVPKDMDGFYRFDLQKSEIEEEPNRYRQKFTVQTPFYRLVWVKHEKGYAYAVNADRTLVSDWIYTNDSAHVISSHVEDSKDENGTFTVHLHTQLSDGFLLKEVITLNGLEILDFEKKNPYKRGDQITFLKTGQYFQKNDQMEMTVLLTRGDQSLGERKILANPRILRPALNASEEPTANIFYRLEKVELIKRGNETLYYYYLGDYVFSSFDLFELPKDHLYRILSTHDSTRYGDFTAQIEDFETGKEYRLSLGKITNKYKGTTALDGTDEDVTEQIPL